MADKRTKSIININKNISNYASKPNQYNNIDSYIKNRINSKKNNSICYINGYKKNKENFMNSKNNPNNSNINIELNTTNYNIM